MGLSFLIGDDDLFMIYKNTDTSFFPLGRFGQTISHFEIRTQIGTWRTGLAADIVIVKNQIIYLDTNKLFMPVVALMLDPDLPVVTEPQDRGIGFISDSVRGCMVSGYSTVPVLGVYLPLQPR